MTEQASGRDRAGARADAAGGFRVEDPVVLKLAGLAAREVEGVEMRRSSAVPVVRSVFSGAAGGGEAGDAGEDLTVGVYAEVGDRDAAIDLTMAVEFGRSIPQVTDAVRRNVVRRVEGLAGLTVGRVGIEVVDVVADGAGGAR